MLKIVVVGAAGKMGKEVCKAVENDSELKLVGVVDKNFINKKLSELFDIKSDLTIREDLEDVLRTTSADVMVDFTHPSSVMNNIKTAIKLNIHTVVGTTGLSSENLDEVKSLQENIKANVFIAPNFAIGAVLMMRLSGIAAKYFPNVEIIELHHDQKADAPSGTAIKTAEMIEAAPAKTNEKETIKGSRGGEYKNIHIHSVRLPGLVAHQEVIFGGQGQTLKIRHDSIDRTSFMPGVIMAIKAVKDRPGLTYGLECLLEI
ncbi:MAG: 4-hydroxy-tetrahydrodipicolinate reductase [Actinobacteria bacterium]|nr:4-hydroxy-tetrahydrodipicolinate reductase [Actinomycetota bacterium]